jgi:hypothetical protein
VITKDAVNHAAAERLHGELLGWLLASAYPLWAQMGYDHEQGGFHERLSADGPLAEDPRRARVQVRQVYCFANAVELGWDSDPVPLVSGGLEYFLSRYRRPDGLFRTLCAANGAPLDERAFLYDQSFVLLALAESQKVLGPQSWLRDEARVLMSAIGRLMKRPGLGFHSGLPAREITPTDGPYSSEIRQLDLRRCFVTQKVTHLNSALRWERLGSAGLGRAGLPLIARRGVTSAITGSQRESRQTSLNGTSR